MSDYENERRKRPKQLVKLGVIKKMATMTVGADVVSYRVRYRVRTRVDDPKIKNKDDTFYAQLTNNYDSRAKPFSRILSGCTRKERE